MSKRSGYSTTYFAQRRLAQRFGRGGGTGSGAGYTPGGAGRAAPVVVTPQPPVNDMARPVTDESLSSTPTASGRTPTGGSTNGLPGGIIKVPPGAGTPPTSPNSGPAPFVLPQAPTTNPRTGRPFRNPDDATKIQLNGATTFSSTWDSNDQSFANLRNQPYQSVNEGLQALSKALGSQVNIAILENQNDYRTKPSSGPQADGLFNSGSKDATFTRAITNHLDNGFKNGFNTQQEKYALHVAIHEFTHAKDPMLDNPNWAGRLDLDKLENEVQLLVEGTCEYRARQLSIKQFGKRNKPHFGAYDELADGIRMYTRLVGTNSFENLWAQKTLAKRMKHFDDTLENSLRTQVEPTLGKVPTDALMNTLRPKFTKFTTDMGVQKRVNSYLDANDQAGLGTYLQGIAPKL